MQVEILSSRQGGKDALPLLVYSALSNCSHRELVGFGGNQSLWLVVNENETLKDTLLNSGVEVQSLDCSKVSRAIVKNFSSKKNDLYILSDRFQGILTEIGLGCDDHIIISTQRQRLKIAQDFLPQLSTSDFFNEHSSLLVDLVVQCNPPMHQMIESGAISSMLDTLNMNRIIQLLGGRRSLLDELLTAGFDLDLFKLLPALSSGDDAFVDFFSHALSNAVNSSPNATWDSIIPNKFCGEMDRVQSIKEMRDSNTKNGVLSGIKLDDTVRLSNVYLNTMTFRGRYGFNMLCMYGRAIVKEPLKSGTKVGAVIIAVGPRVLNRMPFEDVRAMMRREIIQGPSTITFAEDPEFISLLTEEVIPRVMKVKAKKTQD
jgi:hypothetical protein